MTSHPGGPVDARGYGGTLQPGVRPALLVIDFVKAYTQPDSPLYAGPSTEGVRVSCEELLGLCRRAGIPVLHTNLAYQDGGRDGGVFFRKVPALKVFERSARSPLAEFAPGLSPQAGEVVLTKQYASAFFGTTLAATLTALSVDTLLIAGMSTSGCVRATGVDTVQHGFIPLVVRDAVGDRASGPHEANLFDLQTKYAEVVTLERVRTYLAGLKQT
jgi:nicotinamidase-related amidase